ncbi:response regulator [Desulforhabdus amnigena]|jgi:DNA-binding NarL/FixJ family response regulator|uniref:Response regulatory domain-containing protein n=1 Tax=Desulforhabdus amnigena TaxID=40218 RepID=A0A9W6D3X0_9BACT|nr:response regulator transcription factor [Desulforhabdus amnigena]GLI34103.1 hypothetical protein DAMNIGENAA_15360 [Desulforhabdus amnigena]
MNARILLVDDHKMLRNLLRVILEDCSGICVVGEAENGQEALELAMHHKPDVVLMDISMPQMDGITATRKMITENPGIKVIAFSIHSGSEYVKRISSEDPVDLTTAQKCSHGVQCS